VILAVGRPLAFTGFASAMREPSRTAALSVSGCTLGGLTVSYVPNELFESAVPYYARYRSGYPADGLDALATQVGLDSSQRVLDIGCGTGQVSIPLARHAGTVVAIDPLAEMLACGRNAARAAGADNITWLQGDSRQLAALIEPGARAAVFAASFHWTDRPAVVSVLSGLLDRDGSIVVINDDLDDSEQPDWVDAIAAIRSRYLGAQRRAGSGAYSSSGPSHREVLSDSAFSAVEARIWSWNRELTVAEVVGLQFSYSFSTPALFGDRAEAFGDDVRDALLALHPSGVVTEPFQVEVLVATRLRRGS
jgi:ubiquinone/menaquinone biosynthesis C-methylase UbiE